MWQDCETNNVLGSFNNRITHKTEKMISGVCLALGFSSTSGIGSPILGTVFFKENEKLQRAERKADWQFRDPEL